MKHRWIGLPGRHIENRTLLTYFQAPCGSQKLRVWIKTEGPKIKAEG